MRKKIFKKMGLVLTLASTLSMPLMSVAAEMATGTDAGVEIVADEEVENVEQENSLTEEVGSTEADEFETFAENLPAVLADGGVEFNETNFPDPVFRKVLEEDYGDFVKDGVISPEENVKITMLFFSSAKEANDIENLKGLELLTSVDTIDFSNCPKVDLSTIPSTLSNITSLSIQNCEIQELDLSKFPNLKSLSCRENDLNSLDISGCLRLEYLDCSENKNIKTLDVSNNSRLKDLRASRCGLTDGNLTLNNVLETVYIANNSFTTIQLPASVKGLYISGNKFEEIDLSNLNNLTMLSVGTNPFASTFPECCHLTEQQQAQIINLSVSQLEIELDLSKFQSLQNLDLSRYKLTGVDLTHNTELRELQIYSSALTELDLSKNVKLETLIGYSLQSDIPVLDLSQNKALSWVSLSFNGIETVLLPDGINPEMLALSYNELVTLDLSDYSSIGRLFVDHNRLISLHLPTGGVSTVDCSEQEPYTYDGTGCFMDLQSIDPKFDYSKVKNLVGANNTGKYFDYFTDTTIEYDYVAADNCILHVTILLSNIELYKYGPEESEEKEEPKDTGEPSTEVTTEEPKDADIVPPTEITTEASQNSDHVAKTGDESPVKAVLALLAVSVAGALVLWKKMKENK